MVQQLEANLVRVLGPDVDGKTLRAVSREGMRSYARYWLEVFRLPVMPVERLVEGMHAEGPFDTAFGYLAEGRGVVFALPHMGNWDQAGAWIMAKGAGSITAVMERLKPESVYEKFVAFREGLGMEVLPASGGARPFGILAQRLRTGKVVVLVADRDVTGTGIEVDFFGEKCMMQPGSGCAGRADRGRADAGQPLVRRRRLGRCASARRYRCPALPIRKEQCRVDDAGRRPVLRGRHPRASAGLAHAAAGVRRRPRSGAAGSRPGSAPPGTGSIAGEDAP